MENTVWYYIKENIKECETIWQKIYISIQTFFMYMLFISLLCTGGILVAIKDAVIYFLFTLGIYKPKKRKEDVGNIKK